MHFTVSDNMSLVSPEWQAPRARWSVCADMVTECFLTLKWRHPTQRRNPTSIVSSSSSKWPTPDHRQVQQVNPTDFHVPFVPSSGLMRRSTGLVNWCLKPNSITLA